MQRKGGCRHHSLALCRTQIYKDLVDVDFACVAKCIMLCNSDRKLRKGSGRHRYMQQTVIKEDIEMLLLKLYYC